MQGALVLAILLALAGVGLWLWSLIHCIVNKRLSDGNRILGIILILVLGLLGSLIYLFLPRRRLVRRTGAPVRGRPAAPAARGTARHLPGTARLAHGPRRLR
mgnify:CR=1 FL=1